MSRDAIWPALFLAILLVVCSGDSTHACGANVTDRDDPLPAFTGETLEGTGIDLEEYQQGTVVLNVWGSWCGPCRKEAPALVSAATELAAEDVRFVGVDVRDSRASALGFVREFAIPYPSVFDEASRLAAQLGATAPPWTAVAHDGVVQVQVTGEIDEETLSCVVDVARGAGGSGGDET